MLIFLFFQFSLYPHPCHLKRGVFTVGGSEDARVSIYRHVSFIFILDWFSVWVLRRTELKKREEYCVS